MKVRAFCSGLLLFAVILPAEAQLEGSLSGGLSYSLCLKQAEDEPIDIHSFDFLFEGRTAYTFITIPFKRVSFYSGIFAGTSIFFRNTLFPEASNYIIYDTALRGGIFTGPFLSLTLGKHFEPYLDAGFTLLGILVNHREATAYQGDIHYERFEVNTGLGLRAGTRFRFGSRGFLDFGAFFAWYFANHTRVTSKYDTYAGFADHFSMFEIRPFFTAGLLLGKGKKDRDTD